MSIFRDCLAILVLLEDLGTRALQDVMARMALTVIQVFLDLLVTGANL